MSCTALIIFSVAKVITHSRLNSTSFEGFSSSYEVDTSIEILVQPS